MSANVGYIPRWWRGVTLGEEWGDLRDARMSQKDQQCVGGVNRDESTGGKWATNVGCGDGPTFRRRCDAKRWVECAAAGMSQAPRIERAAQ